MSNLKDILVWTDTHISHKRSLDFCRATRPFALDPLNPTQQEILDMDEWIIKQWNTEAKGKTIYFLGDFTFSRDEGYVKEVFSRLEGDKHLIVGNHDHQMTRDLPWSSVSNYKVVRAENEHFVMFHYPMSSWDRMLHGSYHIYGHVHGEYVPGKETMRMFEPAIDNGYFKPVSLLEIVNLLKDRQPTNPPTWS